MFSIRLNRPQLLQAPGGRQGQIRGCRAANFTNTICDLLKAPAFATSLPPALRCDSHLAVSCQGTTRHGPHADHLNLVFLGHSAVPQSGREGMAVHQLLVAQCVAASGSLSYDFSGTEWCRGYGLFCGGGGEGGPCHWQAGQARSPEGTRENSRNQASELSDAAIVPESDGVADITRGEDALNLIQGDAAGFSISRCHLFFFSTNSADTLCRCKDYVTFCDPSSTTDRPAASH